MFSHLNCQFLKDKDNMWLVLEILEALRNAARGIIKCRTHSKALWIQKIDGSV